MKKPVFSGTVDNTKKQLIEMALKYGRDCADFGGHVAVKRVMEDPKEMKRFQEIVEDLDEHLFKIECAVSGEMQ